MSLQISITPQLKPAAQPTIRPPLWFHLEDQQIPDSSWGGGVRPCASCPAVWVVLDDQHVVFDRHWQSYLVAINHAMTLENVMLLMDYKLAFFNRTGVTNPTDPRNDWITGAVTNAKDPQQDKVRVCSRDTVTGTPSYSLATAIRQTVTAVTDRARGRSTLLAARSIRSLLTANNALDIVTFDSRQRPPIKPGRTYPTRMEDVNIEDYVFNPREHPWMFVVAKVVNRAGGCVQFPRGGIYPWTGDNTPRSFLPLVSNHAYGPVRYPYLRTRLRALGPIEPIPSHYRHV